jgi:hypothetical protein
VLVARHVLGQPLGSRLRADENEQRAGWNHTPLPGAHVLHRHGVKLFVAHQLGDLAVQHHLDARQPDDAVGELARQFSLKILGAHHEDDPGGAPGQEHSRLAGGVATSDDDHRVAPTMVRVMPDELGVALRQAAVRPWAPFGLDGQGRQLEWWFPARRRRLPFGDWFTIPAVAEAEAEVRQVLQAAVGE